MTLLTDKDLKSKNFKVKKVFILAKDINSILNQSQKFLLEKGLFFWITLIQAVVFKTLRLFYKKILFRNISVFPLLRAEINGGP